MMRIFRYDYELVWTKGEKLYLADTLSRAYLEVQGNEPDTRICAFEKQDIPDERIQEIQEATQSDEQSQILIHYIRNGWPDHQHEVLDDVRMFYEIHHTLSYEDGIIYKGERLFIPRGYRDFIKRKLHASHNMPETMMRRARETVYWPGMAKEIKVSQITVLRYGVALVNGCGLKQWYIMY